MFTVATKISQLYEIVERNLKRVQNPEGDTPYYRYPELLNREVLTKRDVSKAGFPQALIKLTPESTFTTVEQFRDEESVEELTAVAHTPADPENPGTSEGEMSYEGAPNWGNYRYTLTIVNGGTVGEAGITYTLTRAVHNWTLGTYSDEEDLGGGEVALDGTVDIPDGTTLTFSAGTLVADETYSWESVAHKIAYRCRRQFELVLEVRILLAEHLSEDLVHWVDQLLIAFLNHEEADDDGSQIFSQQMLPPRFEEMVDERTGDLIAFDLVAPVRYSGEIWEKDYSPAARLLSWDQQPIDDID